MISVASETGVILDTLYTGKTMLGMLSEMRVNPHRFRGNRILFINTGFYHHSIGSPHDIMPHPPTGGMFNAFSGIVDDVIKTTPSSSRINGYSES